MGDKQNAQTPEAREMIESLDQEFALLHSTSCELIRNTSADDLYSTHGHASVGENILRSSAAVERTFGGITANLWDDPFEWTLPEYLSTPDKVIEHLNEVEAVRQRAFSSLADDSVLHQHVATPTKEDELLVDLLQKTLAIAVDFQQSAEAVHQALSANRAARFII